MLGCDGVSGAWTPVHTTRIRREKKLVEASQVLAIHACPLWVNLVESVEDPAIGRVAKDEAEITSCCTRCENSLDRGTRVGERFVGTLLWLAPQSHPIRPLAPRRGRRSRELRVY